MNYFNIVNIELCLITMKIFERVILNLFKDSHVIFLMTNAIIYLIIIEKQLK